MSNPRKTLWLGRLSLTYIHARYAWGLYWRPRITRAWSGKITHLSWLCFDIGWDARRDVLGDLLGLNDDTDTDTEAPSP